MVPPNQSSRFGDLLPDPPEGFDDGNSASFSFCP